MANLNFLLKKVTSFAKAASPFITAGATAFNTVSQIRANKKLIDETTRSNRAIEQAEQKRFALQKQATAEKARKSTLSQIRKTRLLKATALNKQVNFGGGGSAPSSISTGSSQFAGGTGSTQSQSASNQSFLNTQLALGSQIADEDESIFGIKTNLNTATARIQGRANTAKSIAGGAQKAASIFQA